MDFSLEDSTTEKVSPILDQIIKHILYQNKCSDSIQKDFMFVLIVVLMIENGFQPLSNDSEVIDNVNWIDAEQLMKWKSTTGIMQAMFVMKGFESMPLKLIVSPLGATVLVNVVINHLNSETYSVCMPISRYIVSPQASTIPMIFRDLKHLSVTYKNKIVCAVKSRILSHFGYPSASLIGIPEEVLYNIVLHLPVPDILFISRTCRRLKILIDNDSLWHELYKRDFPGQDVTSESDWKGVYKEKHIEQRDRRQRQNNMAGSMHDYMDYSDYISYIDNPMWDIII